MRLLWLVAGFLVGVIVSRNSEPMTTPQIASVFLGAIIGVALAWLAGNRGKVSAVATAVAVAKAEAAAAAEASANAAANAAVNLVIMSNASEVGRNHREQIVKQATEYALDRDEDSHYLGETYKEGVSNDHSHRAVGR